MTAHPDQSLLDLGRQFNDALRQARPLEKKRHRAFDERMHLSIERGISESDGRAWRALDRESGHHKAYSAFCKVHGEACRIMRLIHRTKATTLEGFAVKCQAVAFDQFDFAVDPKEANGDVAEIQLLRLSRQMTAVVHRPSQLPLLIAAFHEATAKRDAEWNKGNDDGPEQDAVEAAEDAVLRFPCQTLDEVRVKARFFLNNSGPYDTIRNCFDAKEETLLPFLRSLAGGES